MTTWTVALAALLFSAGANAVESPCPEPLRVGWDAWPPFHYRNAQNQLTGSAVEVLKEASRRLGCRLDFQETPWPRTLRSLKSGELDIAMEAMATPERLQFVHASHPYNPGVVRFWVDARHPLPKARDLSGLLELGQPLGTVEDYSYGEAADTVLNEGVKRGQVQPVRDDRQNIRKLRDGRLLGFFGEESSVAGKLANEGLDATVVMLPKFELRNDAAFLFSRKTVSRVLVDQYDHALAAMTRDGSLQRILDRFRADNRAGEGAVIDDSMNTGDRPIAGDQPPTQ